MLPLKILAIILEACLAASFEVNKPWHDHEYVQGMNVPNPKNAIVDTLLTPPGTREPLEHKTVSDFDPERQDSENVYFDFHIEYEDGDDYFEDFEDYYSGPGDVENLKGRDQPQRQAYRSMTLLQEAQNSYRRRETQSITVHKGEEGSGTYFAYGNLQAIESTPVPKTKVSEDGLGGETLRRVTFYEPLRGSDANEYVWYDRITRSEISVESYFVSRVHTTVHVEPVFYHPKALRRHYAFNPAVDVELNEIPTITLTPLGLLPVEGEFQTLQAGYYEVPLSSSVLEPSSLSISNNIKKTPRLESVPKTKLASEMSTEPSPAFQNTRSTHEFRIESGSESRDSEKPEVSRPKLRLAMKKYDWRRKAARDRSRILAKKTADSTFSRQVSESPLDSFLGKTFADSVQKDTFDNSVKHDELSLVMPVSGQSLDDSVDLSISPEDLPVDTIDLPLISLRGTQRPTEEAIKIKSRLRRKVEVPLGVVIERLQELYVTLANTLQYLVRRSDFKFDNTTRQAEQCWLEIIGDEWPGRPFKLRSDLGDTLGRYQLVSSVTRCYDSVIDILRRRPEGDQKRILERLLEFSALPALARKLKVPFARLVFEEQKLHRFAPHQMDSDRRLSAGLPRLNEARGAGMFDLAMKALSLKDYASALVWLSYVGEFRKDADYQRAVDLAISQHDHALAHGDAANTLKVAMASGQATAEAQRPHTWGAGCTARLQQNDGLDHRRKCWYKAVFPYFYLPPLKVELVSYEPLVVIYHDVATPQDCVANALVARKQKTGAQLQAAMERNLRTDYKFFGNLRNERPVMSPVLAARLALLSRGVLRAADFHLETSLPGFRRRVLPIASYGERQDGHHQEQGVDSERRWYWDSLWTVFLSSNTGGGTVFPRLNTTVFPPKRSVLQVQVLYGDGQLAPEAQHVACPVVEGDQNVLQLKGFPPYAPASPAPAKTAEPRSYPQHTDTETITPTVTTISTGVTAESAPITPKAGLKTVTPTSFWNSVHHRTAYASSDERPYFGAEVDLAIQSSMSTENLEPISATPENVKPVRVIAKSRAYVVEARTSPTITTYTNPDNGPLYTLKASVVPKEMAAGGVGVQRTYETKVDVSTIGVVNGKEPFLATLHVTRTTLTPVGTVNAPVKASGERLEVVRGHLREHYTEVVQDQPTVEQDTHNTKVDSSRDHIDASEVLVGQNDGKNQKKAFGSEGQYCLESPRSFAEYVETVLSLVCDMRQKFKHLEPPFKN